MSTISGQKTVILIMFKLVIKYEHFFNYPKLQQDLKYSKMDDELKYIKNLENNHERAEKIGNLIKFSK